MQYAFFKTHASYPIEEGDLLFMHPADGTVRPASGMANQGSASLNQDAFQQYFVGVASQKIGLQSGESSFKLTTDPGYVKVAIAGEYEYDCASTTWKSGDLVGVYADSNGCYDQQVATAASESLAIGVAKPTLNQLGVAQTSIIVDIRSVVLRNAIQAQVAGSGSGQ